MTENNDKKTEKKGIIKEITFNFPSKEEIEIYIGNDPDYKYASRTLLRIPSEQFILLEEEICFSKGIGMNGRKYLNRLDKFYWDDALDHWSLIFSFCQYIRKMRELVIMKTTLSHSKLNEASHEITAKWKWQCKDILNEGGAPASGSIGTYKTKDKKKEEN
ncbi:MAG: hypothetical protein ACFFD4_08135 [Candidatus Odinarchaeota archaeon]